MRLCSQHAPRTSVTKDRFCLTSSVEAGKFLAERDTIPGKHSKSRDRYVGQRMGRERRCTCVRQVTKRKMDLPENLAKDRYHMS